MAGEQAVPSKESWLKLLETEGARLRYAPPSIRFDADCVLAAVRCHGDALQHAHESCRRDRALVLAAVQNAGWAFQYAHESLRGDRDLALAAVSNCGLALRDVEASLQNDDELVLAAVRQDGAALEHCGEACRANASIVQAALEQDGMLLRWAATSSRADKALVLLASRQNGDALRFAAPELQADKDCIIAQVSQNGSLLATAPAHLRADREVALAAVRQNGLALAFAEGLQADKEVALAAVQQSAEALSLVHSSLQDDSAILRARRRRGATLAEAAADKARGPPQITLSVRIIDRTDRSVHADPNLPVTLEFSRFAAALKNSPDFQDFNINTPDFLCSGSCGPADTRHDVSFPCRGECEVVCAQDATCSESPQCWRRCFRELLHHSNLSRGFMLQVVEVFHNKRNALGKYGAYMLSPNQEVERAMAEAEAVPVMKVCITTGDEEQAVAALAKIMKQQAESGRSF